MAALEDRLRERFEAGLVCDVRPPDFGTRLTILRKRVQQDGVARRRPRRARADRRAGRLQRPRARGRADPHRRLRLAHRPAGHRRARRGGPRRPLSRPAPARPRRWRRSSAASARTSTSRCDELVSPSRAAGRRLAAPGRHVPHARAHRRRRCRRSAAPSATATTRRCCTPASAPRRASPRTPTPTTPCTACTRSCAAMPTGLLERLVHAPPPRILRQIRGFVHTIHNPDDGDPDLIIDFQHEGLVLPAPRCSRSSRP